MAYFRFPTSMAMFQPRVNVSSDIVQRLYDPIPEKEGLCVVTSIVRTNGISILSTSSASRYNRVGVMPLRTCRGLMSTVQTIRDIFDLQRYPE